MWVNIRSFDKEYVLLQWKEPGAAAFGRGAPVVSTKFEDVQEGFAQIAALGVVVRSECRFEAKVSIFDACAADLKRHCCDSQQMR